jgi:superfamily II DNA or RNA helicase
MGGKGAAPGMPVPDDGFDNTTLERANSSAVAVTAHAPVAIAASAQPDPLHSFLDQLPPVCDVLRPYQREQLADIAKSIRAAVRKILAQLPTGAGKTHEIGAITLAAYHSRLRVLILATRTRLVRQIHERLRDFGVPHGVIAAELRGMTDRFQTVQVASADTLYRRCLGSGHMPLPPAEIVIFDEAHLAAAASRMKLLEQYPNAVLIGFSATPARKSGKSLSAVFDQLIIGPSIPDLIDIGMLVRPRIFAVPVLTHSELASLPKDSSGDYATGASSILMSRPKLTGDVLSNWLRIANGKPTLIFACDKAHGAAIVEEFCRVGIATELLTDQDDEETREAVIARLESRQTIVVVNCFLLAYGVDVPAVEVIVIARPMRSLVMFLQSVGRGLRTAPGKEYCIVIDHGRVVETLGMPTSDFAWTLDDDRNVNRDALQSMARTQADEKPRACPECQHMWLVSDGGAACAACGWAPTPRAKPVRIAEAELHEIGAQIARDEQDRRAFFAELRGIAEEKHWKPNAAACNFKERYGEWPPRSWNNTPATTPSTETRRWILSRQIAWRKARERVMVRA